MTPGQGEEFSDFLAASWPRLLRTAHALMGNRTEAEDVLQTAFAKTYSAWSKVRAADDAHAYVRRIVANEAASSWRRRWRRHEHSRADLPDQPVADPTDALDTKDTLWRAIQQLPPRQRTIVVLRYYEELSETEIAETLGIAPGSVKSQASAAVAAIRRLLPEDTFASGRDRR